MVHLLLVLLVINMISVSLVIFLIWKKKMLAVKFYLITNPKTKQTLYTAMLASLVS